MRDTNSISALTEGKVLAALVETGLTVSLPFGVARYDMLLDTEYGIKRIQCKTAHLSDDVLKFKTCSVHRNPDGSYFSKSYVDEADFFGVYSPQLSQVYVVPVLDQKQMNLRLTIPENGHTAWMASVYEVDGYYRYPYLWGRPSGSSSTG